MVQYIFKKFIKLPLFASFTSTSLIFAVTFLRVCDYNESSYIKKAVSDLEALLINDRKLKITLSSAELCEMELSLDELDYKNTRTRRFIWQLLDSAREKTGFDAAAQRVLIRVYPSKGGGCELYVCKVKDNPEKAHTDAAQDIGLVREALPQCRALYRFSSVSLLLSSCKIFADRADIPTAAAYAGAGEAFLLIKDADPSREELSLFSEFGVLCNETDSENILENAKIICKDHAIERLSALTL